MVCWPMGYECPYPLPDQFADPLGDRSVMFQDQPGGYNAGLIDSLVALNHA